MTVSFTEAKARLSGLIAAAEHGEDVLTKRRGQPVERLLAMQPARSGFRFGLLMVRLGASRTSSTP